MHNVFLLLGKLVVSTILTLSAHSAWATIKLHGVTGVSNSKNLTASTTSTGTSTTPIIYGGIGGSATGGDAAVVGSCANRVAGATCNSCDSTPFGVCNTIRIYPELDATFTVSSDKVETGGKIYIVEDDDDDTLIDSTGSDDLAKNQTGTVSVSWLAICNALGSANCATDQVGKIKIGISVENDDDLEDSGDDTITVNVVIHGTIDANHGDCATGADGICQFDVAPGDGKVKLQMLESAGSFPLTSVSNLRYDNVLLFFATDAAGGFAAITPASDYYALSITDLEDDEDTTFSLDSEIADGLENETLYYFKVAVQDEAGNVGLWTPDSLSIACADTTPTAYTPPCHTAKPGDVLGILSKDVNCFVATAAWGSPMAAQVNTFRAFRNTYLLPYKLGRKFVNAYYKYGSIAARYIAQSDVARAGARVALTPLLGFAWLAMKIGILGALALTLLMIASPIAFLKIRSTGNRATRNDT